MFIDAIDSLRGGPKTQMRVWAGATLGAASAALIDHGAHPLMSLEELLRVDESAATALAWASMYFPRATPADVPPTLRPECKTMKTSCERIMAMPVVQPPRNFVEQVKHAVEKGAVAEVV